MSDNTSDKDKALVEEINRIADLPIRSESKVGMAANALTHRSQEKAGAVPIIQRYSQSLIKWIVATVVSFVLALVVPLLFASHQLWTNVSSVLFFLCFIVSIIGLIVTLVNLYLLYRRS